MITSIEMAKKLNVVHRHLLRAIRKIETGLIEESFDTLWEVTGYSDSKNRVYPLYIIHSRGVMLLLFQLSIEPKIALEIVDSLKIRDKATLALSGLQIRTKTEITYVYFITDNTKVKIGIAKDTTKRLKQLQTSSPGALRLYRCIELPNRERALLLERTIHKELRAFKVKGAKEWFTVTPRYAFDIGVKLL